jgi:hypothetical protein
MNNRPNLIPNIFERGYRGDGKYLTRNGAKDTKEYKTWYGMLERCYSGNKQKSSPTYIGCKVCDEWLNFQVFAEWYNSQPYSHKQDIKFDLDKDLLIDGNKIYSPETCILIPSIINMQFANIGKGIHLPGANWLPDRNKFMARGPRIEDGKQSTLGYFSLEEEAHKAYINAKENYIQKLAELYSNVLDIRIYQKLSNYSFNLDLYSKSNFIN